MRIRRAVLMTCGAPVLHPCEDDDSSTRFPSDIVSRCLFPKPLEVFQRNAQVQGRAPTESEQSFAIRKPGDADDRTLAVCLRTWKIGTAGTEARGRRGDAAREVRVAARLLSSRPHVEARNQ